MYKAGLLDSNLTEVKLELDSNGRALIKPRTILRNFLSKTMQQLGVSYYRWSGVLAFDNSDEREFILSLYNARTFYFHDTTLGGPSPVLVYWAGDGSFVFDDPMTESGSIVVALEQVTNV